MVCVQVGSIPLVWSYLSHNGCNPAICFEVLVEDGTRGGSFPCHPVGISLVNKFLISTPCPTALLYFSHVLGKPWKSKNLSFLILLIRPPSHPVGISLVNKFLIS